MNHILSNSDKLSLEIEGIKRNLKGYVIVEKKDIIDEWRTETTYDLYELNEEELSVDFSNQTLKGFSEKYISQPLKVKEMITTISVYHEGDVVHEFGLPVKVLVFEPHKPSYVKEINHTRLAISQLVEGEPEYVYVGRDDLVLICNEVGMLIGLPQDRGLYGTFLIMGLRNGKTVSLSEEQIKEAVREFDKKENYESKSKYLQSYFQENPIPRKVFTYETDSMVFHIGTESIIEFILKQESKDQLQMIELEIRDIQRNNRDIYTYLKSIGYQMAKRQK